ncbi:hypothetical protein ACPA9J_09975 [Pseudomonas aeruginosa]
MLGVQPGARLALKASCDYLLQTDVRRIARRNRQLRERIAQRLYRRLGWTPLEQGPHASAVDDLRGPRTERRAMAEAPPRARRERLLHRPAVCPLALREQAARVLRLTPHYLTDDSEIEAPRRGPGGLPATARRQLERPCANGTLRRRAGGWRNAGRFAQGLCSRRQRALPNAPRTAAAMRFKSLS